VRDIDALSEETLSFEGRITLVAERIVRRLAVGAQMNGRVGDRGVAFENADGDALLPDWTLRGDDHRLQRALFHRSRHMR
jgi:hypothetical protein